MIHYNCPELKKRTDDYIENYNNSLANLRTEETDVLENKRDELKPKNFLDYFRTGRMSKYKMIQRVLKEREKDGK